MTSDELPEIWIDGQCIGHMFEVLRTPDRLYWTIDLQEPYLESLAPLLAWYFNNDCRTVQVQTGETRKDIQAYLMSANWDYFKPIVEVELGLR